MERSADDSVVHLPPRATVEESFQVLAKCESIERSKAAQVLDASECQMLGPIGVALLALALARRRSAGLPALTLREPKLPETRQYLAEIGFQRFLTGSRADENPHSGTLQMRHLFELTPIYTEEIAHLIASRVPGTPEDVGYLVQLCLNELLQNVFEHAESKEGCFVTTRWYARTRSVRIAVVDGGVGIPAALRRKGVAGLQRKGDAEVIVEAVTTKGITSRSGTKTGGFGLKLLHEAATDSSHLRFSGSRFRGSAERPSSLTFGRLHRFQFLAYRRSSDGSQGCRCLRQFAGSPARRAQAQA